MPSTNRARKSPAAVPRRPAKPARERVLIEFPSAALRRADEAARTEGVSRSEFIRAAVEQRIEEIAGVEFERELEEAYKANGELSLEILKEFEHVDREGFEGLK